MADRSDIRKKLWFNAVDATQNGYELLALTFDGTLPHFKERAKSQQIADNALMIYYDMQCPYILKNVDIVKQYCKEHEVPVNLQLIDTLEKAKELPCVFNNWAVFYKGKFIMVNLLLDTNSLVRILKK